MCVHVRKLVIACVCVDRVTVAARVQLLPILSVLQGRVLSL